jgi:hypothetical protein
MCGPHLLHTTTDFGGDVSLCVARQYSSTAPMTNLRVTDSSDCARALRSLADKDP